MRPSRLSDRFSFNNKNKSPNPSFVYLFQAGRIRDSTKGLFFHYDATCDAFPMRNWFPLFIELVFFIFNTNILHTPIFLFGFCVLFFVQAKLETMSQFAPKSNENIKISISSRACFWLSTCRSITSRRNNRRWRPRSQQVGIFEFGTRGRRGCCQASPAANLLTTW